MVNNALFFFSSLFSGQKISLLIVPLEGILSRNPGSNQLKSKDEIEAGSLKNRSVSVACRDLGYACAYALVRGSTR